MRGAFDARFGARASNDGFRGGAPTAFAESASNGSFSIRSVAVRIRSVGIDSVATGAIRIHQPEAAPSGSARPGSARRGSAGGYMLQLSFCADPNSMSNPTIAMRVIRPFLEVVKEKGFHPRILRFVEQADPDTRLSLGSALSMLDVAVRMTGDPDLGLRAALRIAPGDYAALEYVATSCQSFGEALDALERYFFLAYDGAPGPTYSRENGRVYVEYFRPEKNQCRAAVDYALAIAFMCHERWVGGNRSCCEVWFRYPQPENAALYPEVFKPGTPLRFDAARSAFIFPESDLAKPMRTADPKLNELLVRYVEDRYGSHPPEASLMAQVRSLILSELDGGNPAADPIAVKLGVSRRTLTRRLEEEGTSFKQLLSDVRCAMAVRYLTLDQLSIAEVVKRLGYSEPAAFHKAFKRWLGMTPIEFMRQQKHSARHST